MDETLVIVLWIIGVVVSFVALVAIFRLFTIARTLVEIRDELRSRLPEPISSHSEPRPSTRLDKMSEQIPAGRDPA